MKHSYFLNNFIINLFAIIFFYYAYFFSRNSYNDKSKFVYVLVHRNILMYIQYILATPFIYVDMHLLAVCMCRKNAI